MTSKTTFARWREEMELSIDESAKLLGLGHNQVCVLIRGADGTGRPAVPREDRRKLMWAIANGIALKPWKLSEEELARQREARRKRIVAQRRARIAEVV